MGRGIACDIVGEPPRSAGRSDSPPGRTRYVALHPLRGTAPVTSRCTRYVALPPLRRAAPVTWHYTRSERVHCLRIGCIAYGSGAPHNAGTHHRRLCRPRTYHPRTGTHEATRAPSPTRNNGTRAHTQHLTTHRPSPQTPPQTQRGRDRFPGHGLVALSGAQRSATDQAVMSTWSSTAARPASRRATGTRKGEQDT